MKKLILLFAIILSTMKVCENVQAQIRFSDNILNNALNNTTTTLDLSVIKPLKNDWKISTKIFEKNSFRMDVFRVGKKHHINSDLNLLGFELGVSKIIRGTTISLNATLEHHFPLKPI